MMKMATYDFVMFAHMLSYLLENSDVHVTKVRIIAFMQINKKQTANEIKSVQRIPKFESLVATADLKLNLLISSGLMGTAGEVCACHVCTP